MADYSAINILANILYFVKGCFKNFMSKKDKDRCPRCKSPVVIVDYCKDGAIWDCPVCGESGIKHMRSIKQQDRKLKTIEIGGTND